MNYTVIRDMQLPRSCGECRLRTNGWRCPFDLVLDGVDVNNARHRDCQLCEAESLVEAIRERGSLCQWRIDKEGLGITFFADKKEKELLLNNVINIPGIKIELKGEENEATDI